MYIIYIVPFTILLHVSLSKCCVLFILSVNWQSSFFSFFLTMNQISLDRLWHLFLEYMYTWTSIYTSINSSGVSGVSTWQYHPV